MDSAFVAGATGYTGREVVRLLHEARVRTFAHVRPDSPQLEAWRARFGALGATVDTTPWDEASMTETLRRLRPSAVFALLGTTRRRGRAAARAGGVEDYRTVDYGLTHLLLRAAVASGAHPRFVDLSSTGVREAVRQPYLAARAQVEAELRASGLPFTIARPSFITGPDRGEPRPLERVAAAAADAVLDLASRVGARRLAARYRSTTGTALAAALVRLAGSAEARDRIFESEALR